MNKTQLDQTNLCKEILIMAQQIQCTLSTISGVQPMPDYVGKIFKMKYYVTPQLKYKFSRAKWYEADYDWINYGEVVTWCTEQFGPHPKQQDAWSRWDHRYEGKIYFRDEKDCAWFMLRWGV